MTRLYFKTRPLIRRGPFAGANSGSNGKADFQSMTHLGRKADASLEKGHVIRAAGLAPPIKTGK